MVKKVFNYIDQIIDNKELKTNVEDKILKKEKELKITIPNILKEFYIRYSDNENILNSFYIITNIEELKIEEDILIIGYSNQFINKYGIKIDELNNNYINVRVDSSRKNKEWIVYDELNSFIINVIVFQAINMLESSAQIDDSEIALEKFFVPLNKSDNKEAQIISYISKNKKVLAEYFVNDRIIYFGADTDETLEQFEEEAEVDLNWL